MLFVQQEHKTGKHDCLVVLAFSSAVLLRGSVDRAGFNGAARGRVGSLIWAKAPMGLGGHADCPLHGQIS